MSYVKMFRKLHHHLVKTRKCSPETVLLSVRGFMFKWLDSCNMSFHLSGNLICGALDVMNCSHNQRYGPFAGSGQDRQTHTPASPSHFRTLHV